VASYTTETKGKKEVSRKQTIVYVELDVEGIHYHGSTLDKNTGEVANFKCRQTLQSLLGRLEKLGRHFPGYTLSLCYKAPYIGYTLQRDLTENIFHYEVVTPTIDPNPCLGNEVTQITYLKGMFFKTYNFKFQESR